MKKSRKDDRDDGFKKGGCGVNYNAVLDRRMDDKRHEREKAYKTTAQTQSTHTVTTQLSASSTFDAFQRMATGREARTLAEKIAGRSAGCLMMMLH